MRVNSSGKGFGLCAIPIKSKVRIFLSANNFMGHTRNKIESYPICEGSALHTV
jgi:hypothetical protein